MRKGEGGNVAAGKASHVLRQDYALWLPLRARAPFCIIIHIAADLLTFRISSGPARVVLILARILHRRNRTVLTITSKGGSEVANIISVARGLLRSWRGECARAPIYRVD
jgi:hypothetical protein